MFDTFISYRRAGGAGVAARVYDFLKLKGFNPFYDMTGMEAGRFDEQLKMRLIQAENFILVLSPEALNRCSSDDDWVRTEIAAAIEYNLNIIVLQDDEFTYPPQLPESIQTISMYQAVTYNAASLSSRLETLPGLLKYPKDSFTSFSSGMASGKLTFSGKYISQYEDSDRGRIIVRKAPAVLHRFGNRVWGKTWFGTRQAWKISGRIYGKKRLAGIYRAKGYLDDGFGTFYLELKGNGALEGYWSGYDNENNSITTGRYVFKKQDAAYKVRYAKVSDFPSITRIADSRLGKNYITEEFLREILNEDDSTFCLVAYNSENSKIAGFCISKQVSYAELKKIAYGKDINELKFEKNIGIIKTVAVDERTKNLGLGSMLLGESLNTMAKQGVTSFASPAWKHAGVVNIASILEKCGFERAIEIPNYWYESSIEEGFNCPHCGNPCHCSCVIYIKI
ncbi:MAG: TIR domain-containing protein [Clostridia bacterium]|nr:TIR domain-containing protein [Clostridia bacterium]